MVAPTPILPAWAAFEATLKLDIFDMQRRTDHLATARIIALRDALVIVGRLKLDADAKPEYEIPRIWGGLPPYYEFDATGQARLPPQ